MRWFVYWLHGSPGRAIQSLHDATGVSGLNIGEFKGNSEIVTLTPSTWLRTGCTGSAGNTPPEVSAAHSEPACCLVQGSKPPQNLKHNNINVGYLVFILKCNTFKKMCCIFNNVQKEKKLTQMYGVRYFRTTLVISVAPCLAPCSFPKATLAVARRAKALE